MAPPAYESINLSTVHSFLKRQSTPTTSGSTIISYSHDLGQGPVLWLVHGYPQSSFIWRHIAPMLKDQVSLFVPELPGYGLSSPTPKATKRSMGSALFEACGKLFPGREIILGGHDRGARLCHRLAVDYSHPPSSEAPSTKILGVFMLDIVPTLVQWQSFANPAASVAYYHWPFLASPSAANILHAYGGDKWVHESLSRISGSNTAAVEKFKADAAWDVYESLYAKMDTLEGSCADYAAAADPEAKEQEDDQANERKIEIPVLVMWSLGKLGVMHGDVAKIWKSWVKDGNLKAMGCGDDVGHYLPEEASDFVGSAIKDFVGGLK